jgi:hypothetical protein
MNAYAYAKIGVMVMYPGVILHAARDISPPHLYVYISRLWCEIRHGPSTQSCTCPNILYAMRVNSLTSYVCTNNALEQLAK